MQLLAVADMHPARGVADHRERALRDFHRGRVRVHQVQLVEDLPALVLALIQLLVRRVIVTAAGLEVDIRREGVAGVIREMIAPRDMEAAE